MKFLILTALVLLVAHTVYADIGDVVAGGAKSVFDDATSFGGGMYAERRKVS